MFKQAGQLKRALEVIFVLPLLFLGLGSVSSTAIAQIPGTLTPIGSMTTARYFHTATLLLNGKVLIAGGRIPNGTASAERRCAGIGRPGSLELHRPFEQ